MTDLSPLTASFQTVPTVSDLPPVERATFVFDFDGTLVDIAETPMGVRVPDGLPRLLARLHGMTSGRVALLSGRPVHELRHFLPAFEGPIVGQHGAEIAWPGVPPEQRDPPADLARLRSDAERAVASFAGAHVEPKDFGFVVHYRQAPDAASALWDAVQVSLEGEKCWTVERAKMAYEVKRADISKGSALGTLLDGFAAKPADTLFAGDDTSDESALARISEANGISIRIGTDPSCARFRMPDPATLRALLKEYVE